jgi:hypothetical protein
MMKNDNYDKISRGARKRKMGERTNGSFILTLLFSDADLPFDRIALLPLID